MGPGTSSAFSSSQCAEQQPQQLQQPQEEDYRAYLSSDLMRRRLMRLHVKTDAEASEESPQSSPASISHV